MAKKQKTKIKEGPYLLKMVLYLVVGAQWVSVVDPELTKQISIPFGLFVGLGFAMHEHFQIDRKIEYAVLLISCLVGFWANSGVMLSIL